VNPSAFIVAGDSNGLRRLRPVIVRQSDAMTRAAMMTVPTDKPVLQMDNVRKKPKPDALISPKLIFRVGLTLLSPRVMSAVGPARWLIALSIETSATEVRIVMLAR
jgi:hypothetical protein